MTAIKEFRRFEGVVYRDQPTQNKMVRNCVFRTEKRPYEYETLHHPGSVRCTYTLCFIRIMCN